MIYVDRSGGAVPDILTSFRVNRARENITALLSGSREHLEQTRIEVDSRIWLSVKPALMTLFRAKCAYCESPLIDTAAANIDHFRPKSGAEGLDGTRPHYYYAWLVYEWENLLITCSTCNVHKRNLFPVKGHRAPLLASIDKCRAVEQNLLLDPCFDAPEQHLAFNEDGYCTPRSERGLATIEVLRLNREALVLGRRNEWHYALSNINIRLRRWQRRSTNTVLKSVAEMLSGERSYTAVVRAVFSRYAYQWETYLVSRGIDPTVIIPAEEWQRARSFYTRPEDPTIDGSSEEKSSLQITTYVPEPLVGYSAMQLPQRERLIQVPKHGSFYIGHAELPPRAFDTIRRIQVRNFKAVVDIDLELPKPTEDGEGRASALMLLGENATGKSSILQGIALALLGTDQIAKLGCDLSAFVHRHERGNASDENPALAEITIQFDAGEPVQLTIDPRTGRCSGNRLPSTVLLGYGPRRFFIDRRRVPRRHSLADGVRTLFDPLALIGNPTSWLMNCDKSRFNASIRALRYLLLLPQEALVSRPVRGKRRGAQIMMEILQGRPEPLMQLSEGYKTTIATSIDIMREMLRYWRDLEEAQGVVLIDEIETHLHPRWKMRILEQLRRAMPRVQFIATTHDPLCLRGLADGEAHVLARDEEGRIERVEDLPDVRGLSVEQLLTSPYFGLFSTEDPKFEEDMAHYFTLAAKRERSVLEEQELEQYRTALGETMVLGSTLQDRVTQVAVAEYLSQRRTAAPHEQSDLEHEAARRLVDLWKAAEGGDES